jgi:hypothetical protein
MGKLYEKIVDRRSTFRDDYDKLLSAYDKVIQEEREGQYFKKGDKIKFTAPNGKKLTGTVITGDIKGKLKVMPDEPNISIDRSGKKKEKAEILIPTTKAKKINESNMKMTFLDAVKILAKGGGEDEAWELAQKDQGLKKGTTREEWLHFAYASKAYKKFKKGN